MIGLSSILLLGFIAENNKNNSFYNPLIGFSTLLITLGAFPQTLLFNPNSQILEIFIPQTMDSYV